MRKVVNPAALQPINYDQLDPARVLPDGQISFYPNSVAKSRGEVVNDVFYEHVLTRSRQVIDDVYEKDGKELPIQTRVVIEYSQIQVQSHLQENLNCFDWEVMDAISTLYTRPNDVIFLDSIYRVIVGKKSMYTVTEKQRNMVNESIEKMRNIPVEIRVVDFFEKDSPICTALQQEGIRQGVIKNYLIPCAIQEYHDKSTGYVYGIRLLDAPPLFVYAKTFGLASLYPLALIDTPLVKTRKNIVLQSFLLRSIDQMYRDRANGNETSMVIKTKDVYSVTEVVMESDTEKARARQKTEQLLSFWTQKRYIAGFYVMQAARRMKIEGYKIHLSEGVRHWNLRDTAPAGIAVGADAARASRGLPASKMQEATPKLAK